MARRTHTAGVGFQKGLPHPDAQPTPPGKPEADLRHNMAIGLQSGAYLYSGAQLDLVCKLAKEHVGVTVTRFRKGVAVLKPGFKLAKEHWRLLDKGIDEKVW